MRRKSNLIKLEDIAQRLQVTKVTVSKALRNHSDISPVMIAKVKKLAEELGYIPNLMAKNLTAEKSNTIGLVIPQIAHFFFGSVIEAVYDTALNNNYDTVITVSQESSDREKRNIISLISMRVDGLIISISQETKDYSILERVLNQKIPLVFIDRVPGIKGTSNITVDDAGGAYKAVKYAIKKGYKKIAHIGGYNHINIGNRRMTGFLNALKDSGVRINRDWIVEGGFGEEDGYKGFNKILKKKNLPEYILSVTYPAALGIYKAAKEKGIRIPEDIEVTCFGNNTFNSLIPSVFNFVDQPTSQLGAKAVKILLNQINNPDNFQPKDIELKTRLVINNHK